METFKKRQKEMLRMEKQRDKAAKRLAKKQQRLNPPVATEEDSGETVNPEATPEDQSHT